MDVDLHDRYGQHVSGCLLSYLGIQHLPGCLESKVFDDIHNFET